MVWITALFLGLCADIGQVVRTGTGGALLLQLTTSSILRLPYASRSR